MEKLRHMRRAFKIDLNTYSPRPPVVVDAETAPHACNDLTCPGDINRRKLELFDRYKKALESLTPGGSEYVDDPKRCAETIRERFNGPVKILKRLSAKLKTSDLCERYQQHREEWHATCKCCEGSGLEPGSAFDPCRNCDGTGWEK